MANGHDAAGNVGSRQESNGAESYAGTPPDESGQEGESNVAFAMIADLNDFMIEQCPDEIKEGTIVECAIEYIKRLREVKDMAEVSAEPYDMNRDAFASSALTGLLTNMPGQIGGLSTADSLRAEYARNAFLMADAMIAAR